jgi:hypothetical protein
MAAISEVQEKAAEVIAEHRRGIEAAGRLGFATKAVVYGLVGGLAIAAAWQGGRAEGSEGAIRKIGEQPFGQILLWITAFGLAGYAVWQFVQAIVGSGRRDSSWMNVLRRCGFAVSAVIHVALAIYAAPVSLGAAVQRGAEKSLAGSVLSLPGGQLLVGIVGACIIGFACREIFRSWTQRFMQDYQIHKMSESQRKTAQYTGIVGLAARGVMFLIAGAFVVIAAVKVDPNQAKGLGESLELLARQPLGPWLLAMAGVGFLCYAVHCGTLALYRRFAVG